MILNNEGVKSTLEPPQPGNSLLTELEKINQKEVSKVTPIPQCGGSDDDFFHITCHIDPVLKEKIEKGAYVDLEKLHLKDRRKNDEYQKLNLVTMEGATFMVPAKTNVINSVRKWEQAFQVYMAIYSAAQPHRAPEIWQYVYVINNAAVSYTWDNVAKYDYMFQKLMEYNPGRSWAKTYTEGWNLSLKEPIIRGGNSQTYTSLGGNTQITIITIICKNKRKGGPRTIIVGD